MGSAAVVIFPHPQMGAITARLLWVLTVGFFDQLPASVHVLGRGKLLGIRAIRGLGQIEGPRQRPVLVPTAAVNIDVALHDPAIMRRSDIAADPRAYRPHRVRRHGRAPQTCHSGGRGPHHLCGVRQAETGSPRRPTG